ncbi:hypothetical protein [Flavonifractor sp. An4]|uniref:hypothetical protein n=1 Tax=Flavonifractor sp. An4 TaxID=1965634 RepID=UPI000B37DE09|nr:hypothetical protein [Flavonifractor sp. An4]OUO12880.1 hypothetical protein B5F94_11205 [Flavonifractor sp. An4]
MDWEAAYEQCPPFGVGKGPYNWETTQVLVALERDLTALRRRLTDETGELLEQYLKSEANYLHSCCRYYYYRGMLHGIKEALEIWSAEYGSAEESSEDN